MISTSLGLRGEARVSGNPEGIKKGIRQGAYVKTKGGVKWAGAGGKQEKAFGVWR